jgi:hypothetical protein
MNKISLAILVVLSASIALADDLKTIEGKEYKNVTVKRVEPDGLVLSSKSGIAKVYFTELPKDVQQRFNYDPEKAAAYSAEQNAALEQARKQQEEALRLKAEATQKNNEQLSKEQAGIEWTRGQRKKIQQLQNRYNELQQQEDDLLLQIGEASRGGSWGRSGDHDYYVRNALADQLPYLRSHLNDVRHEKDEVRQQLQQAQR